MSKPDFFKNQKYYDTSQGYGDAREWRRAFNEKMTGEEAAQILDEERTRANATPYDILDIQENASQSEIKSAYRKLMMIWHPDKNPHNIESATAMSRKIIAAFTKLYKNEK